MRGNHLHSFWLCSRSTSYTCASHPTRNCARPSLYSVPDVTRCPTDPNPDSRTFRGSHCAILQKKPAPVKQEPLETASTAKKVIYSMLSGWLRLCAPVQPPPFATLHTVVGVPLHPPTISTSTAVLTFCFFFALPFRCIASHLVDACCQRPDHKQCIYRAAKLVVGEYQQINSI